MKYYLNIFFALLFLFSGCSDDGTQDIQKIPSTISTDDISILSSTPNKYIAQSSYINIEFSSYLDFDTLSTQNISLKNLTTNEMIEIEIDGAHNHLYIKPLISLTPENEYEIKIDKTPQDIMGNSLDKEYSVVLICKEDFWQEVEVGDTHSMARSKSGDIYVWGSNSYKEINQRDDVSRYIPLPLTDTNETTIFSAGSLSSAYINKDSTLSTFGEIPLEKNDDNDYSKVSIGNKHSTIIKKDGSLYSWGQNRNGQLGNGGILEKTVLSQEESQSSNWSSVSAGYDYTIALKNDGSMWGWGSNEYGQIGYSLQNERRIPTREDTNASDWKIISAGGEHSVAIKEDGTLWSWGNNKSGELASGDETPSRLQVQEITNSTWSNACAGKNHTLGLKTDGTLWAWGDNYYGQLGDGSTVNKNTPTQIGLDKYTSISCGLAFSIAIKENGTIWAWGYDAQGQLGLGDDTQDKLIPTEIK